MNIEQGMLNVEAVIQSTFNIPCSIFDIPSLPAYILL